MYLQGVFLLGLFAGSPAGAADGGRPKATVLPVLDSAWSLSPAARDRLSERLRAALGEAGALELAPLPWGEETPARWADRARRFGELRAAGLDYAVQLFARRVADRCELALLAFYLPAWEHARFAHAVKKELRCGAALEAPLDELVARLVPALDAPPERAVTPPDPGPPVVAVFLMESQGAPLDAEALVAETGRLTAGLAETGKVRVLTRDEIRARILGLSPRGGVEKECFERNCFLRLSRQIEADYAVFSSISKVAASCMLVVQAFAVDPQVTVAAVTERDRCEPAAVSAMVVRSAPKLEAALLGAIRDAVDLHGRELRRGTPAQ